MFSVGLSAGNNQKTLSFRTGMDFKNLYGTEKLSMSQAEVFLDYSCCMVILYVLHHKSSSLFTYLNSFIPLTDSQGPLRRGLSRPGSHQHLESVHIFVSVIDRARPSRTWRTWVSYLSRQRCTILTGRYEHKTMCPHTHIWMMRGCFTLIWTYSLQSKHHLPIVSFILSLMLCV